MSEYAITLTLPLRDAWRAQIAVAFAAVGNDLRADRVEELCGEAAAAMHRKQAAELRALAERLETAIMSGPLTRVAE